MNEKQIRKLIRLVEESEIESLEVSSWGRRVKITQKVPASSNGDSPTQPILQPVTTVSDAAVTPTASQAESTPVAESGLEETGSQVMIRSPMVGTFYTAPSPDAEPYVSLNEKIIVGQVVCIVEAMKLMNEIESEVAGRVVKIVAENGKPVEFGQALFLIDPKG